MIWLSRKRILISLSVAAGALVALYLLAAANYISKCSSPRPSCLAHRFAGCDLNGDYDVKIGSVASEVTCDMKSERGGWTLVANYLHKRGSAGGPTPLERGQFPIQKETLIGVNETGTPAWGHVSRATLSAIPYTEVRFRCQTSAHPRLLDFVITSEKCLNYLKLGVGSCIEGTNDRKELAKGFRSLTGNAAQLPSIADKGWKDQGENALVNYPFYTDYRHHWSIGAISGRYECDDYAQINTTDTFHQIWVR